MKGATRPPSAFLLLDQLAWSGESVNIYIFPAFQVTSRGVASRLRSYRSHVTSAGRDGRVPLARCSCWPVGTHVLQTQTPLTQTPQCTPRWKGEFAA